MVLAVDDSEITIEDRAHTILAGVAFDRPEEAIPKIQTIKTQFRLTDADEIKWNGMKLESKQQREALSEELLVVLSRLRFLVTVSEGRRRQAALEHLAIQFDDYLEAQSKYEPEPAEVRLDYDTGIIDSQSAFASFLTASGRTRLASMIFETTDSVSSELIQCADVCAGFSRLLIELALGRPDRRFAFTEKFGDGSTNVVDTDLRHLVLFSLRYSMWGEVPPPADPNDIQFDGTYPFLHAEGMGLRIHSTISTGLIQQIYEHAGVVYYGCIH